MSNLIQYQQTAKAIEVPSEKADVDQWQPHYSDFANGRVNLKVVCQNTNSFVGEIWKSDPIQYPSIYPDTSIPPILSKLKVGTSIVGEIWKGDPYPNIPKTPDGLVTFKNLFKVQLGTSIVGEIWKSDSTHYRPVYSDRGIPPLKPQVGTFTVGEIWLSDPDQRQPKLPDGIIKFINISKQLGAFTVGEVWATDQMQYPAIYPDQTSSPILLKLKIGTTYTVGEIWITAAPSPWQTCKIIGFDTMSGQVVMIVGKIEIS